MNWKIVPADAPKPEPLVHFALTGEFREPRPGEWFLQISGHLLEPRERPAGSTLDDRFGLPARPILRMVQS